jgi:uroporphyrinogen decarboxylase
VTSLERWLAVLNREQADRIPTDYWATAEASRKLRGHLGVETMHEVFEQLNIDHVITVGPHYVGPEIPSDMDVFGCRHENIEHETGSYRECVENPLAQYDTVEAIEANYEWPNPDWYDYSAISEQVKRWEDYPVRGGGSEPFLIYKKLRGQEQAFMDLIEHPEILHHCLDRLFDLAYTNSTRIYEQIPYRVNLSYVAEDMGGQTGLMMSLAHIREFLLPRMKHAIDLAHEAGAFVFHHNDGAIRDVIPDLIDLGIDVLNPIQWRCEGMDRASLKRDFGADMVFHGAVDNQQTLAFGSTDDVRKEVAENIEILGAGGGYILAPCHNIQSVSPSENIVAMYEAAKEVSTSGARESLAETRD